MRPLHVLVFAAVAVGVTVVGKPPENAEERRYGQAQRGPARTNADYPAYPLTLRDVVYQEDRPYRQLYRKPQPLSENPWLLNLAREMDRKERLKHDDYQAVDMYVEPPPAEMRFDSGQYDYDSPIEYEEPAPRMAAAGRQALEAFALRPQDKAFYSPDVTAKTEGGVVAVDRRTDPAFPDPGFQNMRHLRQNPMKTFVDPESVHMPQAHAEAAAAQAAAAGADVHSALAPPSDDPPPSLYAIAIFTAVGAALSLAVVGIAVGWYTLSMKAKAAEDVDYPAYGVTGPCGDMCGDRRLAHSAQMYHYQHQKQQIIAMERGCGTDERSGSVSDPESEEDNAEGDYTVYECPGYATTGDMEVKNPLFSEEPTPATPAAPAAPASVASPAIVVDQPAAE